jgi:hypothetical protein
MHRVVLIYESAPSARADRAAASIGDGELAGDRDLRHSAARRLPSDYPQAGRIDVGFLGAAQIDKFEPQQHGHRPFWETEDPACQAPAARPRSPPMRAKFLSS